MDNQQILEETSDENSLRELFCISLATRFDEFVEEKISKSTDKRMLLLLCFYKITKLFKMYQHSMRTGDVVMMEKIEVDFCGVFLLLDKNNYVEIILSQIEKKYKMVDYHQLQEIRVNASNRYNKDPSDKSYYNSLHVLDETMENVNMWVKNLPLGDDRESWAMHSPNVTVAQRCRLFNQNEYKRGITNFEKLIEDDIFENRVIDKNKYVPPRKLVEKKRIFECLMIYFIKETPNRQSTATDLYGCIGDVTTPLLRDEVETVETTDDGDLNVVFEEINEIGASNNDNSNENTNTTQNDEDSIDGGDVLSLTFSHHKYVHVDVLNVGKEEMQKKNYIVTRMLKFQRMKRNNDYIHSLFETHKDKETFISNELSWFETEECLSVRPTPTFTTQLKNLTL